VRGGGGGVRAGAATDGAPRLTTPQMSAIFSAASARADEPLTENRELRAEVVRLRRDLLAFAREQWPTRAPRKRARAAASASASAADRGEDEDDDNEFVGGTFWDAVVRACAETNPLPDSVKFDDLEDPALVEFSESERPLAELLLQLGLVERVMSATGAASASRLKLVDEVFGEDVGEGLSS